MQNINESMDLQDIMMEVMCNLAGRGLPIVFKGSNVLSVALKPYGISQGMMRQTQDIDADWTEGLPDMNYLLSELTIAVKLVNPDMYVQEVREYGEHQVATFNVLLNTTLLFSVDIGVHANDSYTVYNFYGRQFYGQTLNKIIADKVAAVSSGQVIRRVKDVYDLYIMTKIRNINYQVLLKTLRDTRDRPIGNFQVFQRSVAQLSAAYTGLISVKSKPPFIQIYNKTEKFLQPFIDKRRQKLVWNGANWIDVQTKTMH